MFVASIINSLQAYNLLSKKNVRWLSKREMIKVELIFLPIYLFSVKLVDNRGRNLSDKISVDGIKGEFAFFKETDYEASSTDSVNKFNCKLSETEARDIAVREYQRSLFRNNMKTRSDARITDFSRGSFVFYPYWIGYFKRKSAYDFEVIDAVSGSKQGIKMRPVFIDLLLQLSKNA